MKKTLITLAIGWTVFIALCAFAFLQQPKTYAVNATLQDWYAVLDVIEHSNSPYTQVVAVKGLIISQIDTKLKAEAKADSIERSKKK